MRLIEKAECQEKRPFVNGEQSPRRKLLTPMA
jgi:hypothetical protein